MRRPDEGTRKQLPFRGKNSNDDQDSRRKKGVNEVVNRSTNSGINEIAEHEKIRREKEGREQDPTRMALVVEKDTQTENRRSFEAEQKRRLCEHLPIVAFDPLRHSRKNALIVR